ncbi:hypothetical protein P154DRAFT_564981 [Amniculicola lignicola CBS 123094]|uniref:Uncharacterized protein n=1 Tax=Amniculicola lignicola CBS 123094 TaxID=1392246 RepID=A0A6A5WCZ2_9PLEO|nr:hypothetical protein P154DRAFT_564981 [Amniculicola lignicola CBS 123094]
MPIQAPVAELNCVDAKKRTKKKRPIRISSSWRWDIDRATFRMGTLDKHFKKPADLFAFHALPVIKGELGPGATNDDIRLRMDEILSELPLTEIKRWDDSFSKLQNGDVNMLGRTVTPDHGQPTSPHVAGIPGSDNVQERDETAPTIRRDDRGVARPGIMSHEPEHVRRNCSVAEVEVKREQEVGAQILVPHEESVMNETISLPRRLSTEPQMNLMSQTPIVGHLWGSETLTDKDFGKFLGKIMGIINQRLPMDTYELSYFGSKSKLLSKRILECDIRNAFKSASFSRERVAYQCESSLMPWVAAQPNSFPEIRKSPLSFVYMFPDITPALDCLIPPNASFPQDNCSTVRRYISFSIKQKEINQLYECGYRNYPLSSQLDSVLMKRNINEAEKRGRVERILRYVALDFKEKFPELKSSKLVRAWEHETGLRW